MITIKSAASIEKMQIAGGIVRDTLALMQELVKPGVSTAYLDREAEAFIRSKGAVPSFLNYQGYPKSICVSINEQVVHGIPDERIILEGDIVSVDVGACINGYHGDAARTFFAGDVSREAERLVRITRECFFEGLKFAREGHFLSEVSAAIQRHAEDAGYSVVREMIGHGIGRQMHEDPEVPNYHEPRMGRGPRLRAGMTIAIEPMINIGGKEIVCADNGWTVSTRDGSLSAHYENTIAITNGDPLVLTLAEEELA